MIRLPNPSQWIFAALMVALGVVTACTASTTATADDRFSDPHIRTLMYDSDRVVALTAFFGYQMMIQFGGNERIENVAIGDGAAWQVTPNKGADLLFIKAIDHAAQTNLTVITDRRSYLFELTARHPHSEGSDKMVYLVRFTYPPEPVVLVAAPGPAPPPEQRNKDYTYTGSRALLPSLVFDDGRFTYFKWAEGQLTPAIFVVGSDGAESVVESSFRDGYQVVAQVAKGFRLRNGKEITNIFNDAWREPTPGADAPRPHDAKTALNASQSEEKP